MKTKFQIGDYVKILGDDNFEYEIIATNETPHVAVDKVVISVPTGSEYVLRMLNQKKSFEPYRYTLEKSLIKI